jgi:hypothetical protein
VYQLRDVGSTVPGKVHGEHVPELDTSKLSHRPTVARRSDIAGDAGSAPATLGGMKAVTCTNAKLEVVDQPTPTPAKGQLLIDVLRCGICGYDLHARKHCDELADVMAETGYPDFMRSNQSVVFGHEFCGEVLDHGPGTRKALRAGTPVVALPLVRRGKDVHAIGLSTAAPGAYAEQLIVEQSLALPVPNGLPVDKAALTEPMAVGWHAVQRGEVKKGQVAIVIGCGPIGLAVSTVEKLHRLRLPWWHVWRAAVLTRRRGGSLHGRRPAAAVDGDQQRDRPALRTRLHTNGIPRHAAHARRRQG